MLSKKLVVTVSALFLAAFATGCGGGGGGSGDGSTGANSTGVTNTGSTNTANNTGTTTTGLSGTVAKGLALPNAKVTLQTVKGDTKDIGTTDNKGQFSGVPLPDGTSFPVVLSVTLPNGKDVLRSIIPSLNNNNSAATANVNPITQAITNQVLPTGTNLANLDVSGFASKAKTVVQAALGSSVDYDTFANKPMQARTADDPKAGGLADTLIDTIAGMDSSRKPEDILASAADTEDPSVPKNLLANSSFQARLSGELISQGRQAGDVTTLIKNEAVGGGDTTTILSNTAAYATAFQDVFTSANSVLTGSDADKRAALSSVVQSAAVTVAKIVDKQSVSSGDSLANVLSNSLTVVKGPLIAIGVANQGQGGNNLALILGATRDQIADLISTSTVDLTASGANVTTLGSQVKNFGNIVSTAVSDTLNSGKDKSGLDDKTKLLVAANVGKGVANSLSAYINDLAVDQSGMTDAQKANLTKATNTAKNAATALDSSLTGMATNKGAATVGTEVLNSMANAVVTQATDTFKNYDLTVDASVFPGAAIKVLSNMATVVVNNAAALSTSTAALATSKQSALTGAMAQQVLQEVKGLDLTGDAPPATALNVATNMAQTIGAALATQVGQVSSYQGSNLQVLASSAVASATAELKKTASLTAAIDSSTLATLQQNASQVVVASKNNTEALFKSFTDQGVSLANVTSSLTKSGLDGSAVSVVLTQVQGAISSGGDAMKSSVGSVADLAANTATAVLAKGGNLSQVESAIATPLASLVQTAKAQPGNGSSQVVSAIKNNSNAMQQVTQALFSSTSMSLGDLIATANNAASVVGSQLSTAGTTVLLNTVKNNVNAGGPIGLDTLTGQLAQTDPGILAKATTLQQTLNTESQSLINSAGDTSKKPKIIVNGDHSVDIFSPIALDASGSSDPQGKTLNYSWTILLSPVGDSATLLKSDTSTPTFTPAVVGDYTLLLIVSNGTDSSSYSFDIKAKLSGDSFIVVRKSSNYWLSADGFFSGGSELSANFMQPIAKMNWALSPGQTSVSALYMNSSGH